MICGGTLARSALGGFLALAALSATGRACAAEPIKIGFSMELTGPLAVVGKTGLLAFQIWAEDTNRKGGLLGRPVELVYYDDQSNPANVPSIYSKLCDVDKVDLVISSYGTNLVVPAFPIVMEHNRLFFGLFGLAANAEFHYPRYFSMLVFGPNPGETFSKGYFDLVTAENPKPKTLAILAADAEFSHNASIGARANAKAAGLEIVYDKTYPPSTVDFTPIVRAVQAAEPDIVYVASYPPDTIGILRAVDESGLKTKMLGGAFVGLPSAALKTQLGPAMNDVVNVELWEPVGPMEFPGVMEFLKKYQARAGGEGIDPLGYSCRPSPMASCRFSVLPSRRPRASMMGCWPTICIATRSGRSSARLPSTPMASGPKGGRSGCSITASRVTTSSNSGDPTPSQCRSSHPRRTRPAR